MLKQSITYKDYNNIERTEDFYFNLTQAEIVEMVAMSDEDLAEKLKKIVEAKNGTEIMRTFKDILFRSYGEKSSDGKRFVKSQEISKSFFYLH